MPDQETIQGQLTLLDTLRKRLRIQVSQQQRLDRYAPAYLALEIADHRHQIASIKRYLDRHSVEYSQNVEDTNQREIDALMVVDRLAALRRSAILFDQHGAGDAEQIYREELAVAVQNIRRDAPLYGVELSKYDRILLDEVERL